jgi:hypothetical protein
MVGTYFVRVGVAEDPLDSLLSEKSKHHTKHSTLAVFRGGVKKH